MRGAGRTLAAALTAALTAATVVALTGPASASPPAYGPAVQLDDPSHVGEGYAATIRRTEFGIPHILAADYGDMGFGYGYAFAEDNICTAADFYVTVRGDRSRFFGPDGSWTFHGNGTTHGNLDSDAYYRAINASGRIEELLDQPPPHGPSDGLVEGVRGYVAGYNRYLADVGGPDGISDPACAGQEWVRPITEHDAYLRFYQLASLASTGIAIGEIGGATPPTPDLGGAGDGDGRDAPELGDLADLLDPDAAPVPVDQLPDIPGVSATQRSAVADFPNRAEGILGIGSNAYGFGAEATENGSGLVLGNPHFPWQGGERLYHAHLTIPGVLDVQGASLYGVPIVLIGTTEGVAWSHTVSTAFRFTPFQLTLVPGSPTTYLVDGQPREMERRTVTVPVRTEDGAIDEVERTLYWTDYGPMMTGILGLPLFPWTPAVGFAMGDANDHLRYLNHFFEKNHAQSVRDLRELTVRNQGVPWVNTIAADASGEAYYSDVSVVPNVPDDKVTACPTALGIVTFAALGLPVLDGARSDCGWDTDPDAVVPGIFGPDNLPVLFRHDYVHNGNDSYWLSNPDEPLTGFARIIGDEETPRTLRTRVGLQMVADRFAGVDDWGDEAGRLWNRPILEQAVFDNRQFAGELTRDDLLDHCRSVPGVPTTSGPPVETAEACDALEGWDVRDDLDSTGAILFRRFVSNLQGMTSPVGDPTGTGVLGLPWTTPFSVDDPIGTPRDLNTLDPRVSIALGDAIADLDGAGIPYDAPLGEWQYETRGTGERIPIHGGPGGVGVFNAINVSWNPETGYPRVTHGSSFVMVATWQDEGCPVDASAIVTYSQSDDVTSPHLADQTREFSEKRFVPMRFCEEDILADPALTVTTVTSEGGASDGDGGVGGDDRDPPGSDRADERRSDRGRERAGGDGRGGDGGATGVAGVAMQPASAQRPVTGTSTAGLLALALLGASLGLRLRGRRGAGV
ncbi:penicillin acylase family protein [Nitriliruptor alkaliphilus]|uniref:penicillin acylase family protein n=1 Tax=Nitriliruptor alkaliphilus TaxID=427918 RepID=UPI00069749D3|nr:penicillin acylase family protein [Nitriliruptor alkaliphilus]